ncbi:MAG: YqgE/AlgH family protein, partial [Myxococcales bacterium]|nr:YqgE/AlgH family protein [Myxococcales bacterium]
EHNEEGAFGVVVNNRIPAHVTLQSADGEEAPVVQDVFLGGPVSPHICMVLHTPEWSCEETQTVVEGICVTEPSVAVASLLRQSVAGFRFIMGYAGWGEGQLESELAGGAWLSTPVFADIVMNEEPDKQWEAAIRRLGIDPLMLVPSTTPQ